MVGWGEVARGAFVGGAWHVHRSHRSGPMLESSSVHVWAGWCPRRWSERVSALHGIKYASMRCRSQQECTPCYHTPRYTCLMRPRPDVIRHRTVRHTARGRLRVPREYHKVPHREVPKPMHAVVRHCPMLRDTSTPKPRGAHDRLKRCPRALNRTRHEYPVKTRHIVPSHTSHTPVGPTLPCSARLVRGLSCSACAA